MRYGSFPRRDKETETMSVGWFPGAFNEQQEVAGSLDGDFKGRVNPGGRQDSRRQRWLGGGLGGGNNPEGSFFFFFWWDWGFNSGLCAYKAGSLSLEPQLQSILLWLF
jgi:hypothetical protein